MNGATGRSAVLERIIQKLIRISGRRGIDGAGFAQIGKDYLIERDLSGPEALAERFVIEADVHLVLINSRLEPTNEYISDPRISDLQPYTFRGLTVVHNGIISNDKKLCYQYDIDTNDLASTIDSAILPHILHRFGGANPDSLHRLAEEIDGSFALAIHDSAQPDKVYLACSYKPLWIAYSHELSAVLFASESELLQEALDYSPDLKVERVPPYTGLVIDRSNHRVSFDLDCRPRGGPTLCVCSGGMDSTTAAAIVRERGDSILFCHFLYGCKAEARETQAVREIANHYKTEVLFVPLPWLGELGGSSLTVAELPITDGNAGVEKAYEWVPARNLLMIAYAVALCERYGYGRVVLGINEQEGEVFPDNEREFLTNLQAAVNIGSPSRIQLEAPLARMSKRDILRTALKLHVPLDITWSCYRSGVHPCGICGSCLQRRVAFLQLGKKDFIQYEREMPPNALRNAVVDSDQWR